MKQLSYRLLFLIFCCVTFQSFAQNKGHCGNGWAKRNVVAEPKYTDRFGNLYAEDEINIQKGVVADCGILQKFELAFSPDFTDQERATICDVFSDIENNIILNAPPNGVRARIDFIKADLGVGVLADATPFYNLASCGISYSTIMQTFAGSSAYQGQAVGRIRVANAFKDQWHHTNDPDNTPAGTWYDLYSVTLHEAMHVLGFASRIPITAQGNISSGQTYSNWDRFLFANGVGAKQFLLKSAPTEQCCQHYELNDAAITVQVDQGCASNVFFTDQSGTLIAPLSCHDQTAGALSHLNEDCLPNSSFIMHPSVSENIEKRVLSNEEIAILCTLGYRTQNNVGTQCSTSLLFANDDCDPTIYTTNSPSGNFNVILNDVILGGYKLSVGAFDKTALTVGILFNTTLTYTFLKPGQYEIPYKIETTDGSNQCFNAILKVVCVNAANLNNPCPDKECIVSSLGGFERFSSDFELRRYMSSVTTFCTQNPFSMFSSIATNTIDLVSEGIPYTDYCNNNQVALSGSANTAVDPLSEKYIGFWSGSAKSEGFCLPLCRSIPAGSQAQVTFYARVNQSCLVRNPTIRMSFLQIQPNSGEGFVDHDSPQFQDALIQSDNFSQYTVTFTNVGTTAMNTLLVSGLTTTDFVYFNVDDIEVAVTPNANFTAAVNCPNITVTPTDLGNTHTWTITNAAGQQVASVNTVMPTFNNLPNGVYTIVHSVKDPDCGEGTVTQQVTVNCLECGCNNANTLNINAAATGTNITDIPQLNSNTIDQNVHNGCIAISGRLVINTNTSILNCPNIIMNPCAEIVVLPGVELTMNNNLIIGCKTMWKGIRVSEKGRLIFENNVIRDAEIAILAVPTTPSTNPIFSSLFITRILLNNNRFEKNHIGLMIEKRETLENINNIRHFPFTNNTFVGEGLLLPPCNPNLTNYDKNIGYAGIYLNRLSRFDIGSTVYKNKPNTFSLLRNGVLASRTNLNVYDATFDSMEGTWATETKNPTLTNSFGIGILHINSNLLVNNSIFRKCGHAVFSDTPIRAIITKSKADDVYRGIEIFKGLNVTVTNNEIKFEDIGILGRENLYTYSANYNINRNNLWNSKQLETSEGIDIKGAIVMRNASPGSIRKARISANSIYLNSSHYGININSSSNWKIDTNTVQRQNFAGNQPFSTTRSYSLVRSNNNYIYKNSAEYLASSPLTNGFYLANSSSNDFCCNYAEGHANGLLFQDGGNNTKIRTFDLFKNNYALLYGPNAVTGVQTNNGNLFTPSNNKVRNLGNFTNIGLSRYEVNSAVVQEFPQVIETPNATNSNWFVQNPFQSLTCSNCQTLPPATLGGDISALDVFVADEGFSGNQMNRTLQWESELELFQRISTNNSILGQNNKIDAFYQEQQNDALAKFVEAEQQVQDIAKYSVENEEKIEELLFRIDDIEKDAKAEYKNFDKAISFEDSLVVFTKAEDIALQGFMHTIQLDYLQTLQKDVEFENASAALPLIEQLNSNELAGQNRKVVMEIYLKWVKSGYQSLNSENQAALYSIAAQCPSDGGHAVRTARLMYSAYQGKYFDDELLCNPSTIAEWSKRSNQTATADFEIFPNPADQEIKVFIGNKNTNDATVVLKDMTGKNVLVIRGNNTITINTTQLQSGIYSCQVLVQGNIPMIKKIIIQH